MTTLQAAIKAIQTATPSKTTKHKAGIADKLLGKFKGALPKGKSSTEFIQEIRSSGYGKIK